MQSSFGGVDVETGLFDQLFSLECGQVELQLRRDQKP